MPDSSAPTSQLGQAGLITSTGGWPNTPGWGEFVESTDHVPELRWPRSNETYEVMRTDGQVQALYVGTTLPIRQRIWALEPNGARDEIVQALSTDLGLPIRGHEDAFIPRRPQGSFKFGAHLQDVLLALVFGHYYFEQVGEVVGGLWRLRKLAPVAPHTIDQIAVERDGGLRHVRQGALGYGLADAPVIPVTRIVGYVWDGDARTRWIGRSWLRALYKHWLLKDRELRIDAINLERGGGVPVIEAPEGATPAQMAELAEMATDFKVGEGAGGSIPAGAKLQLAGVNAPNAIRSIEYQDQAMARAWLSMLVQLGQTQTGSRALGGTFADVMAVAQNAIAGWAAEVFTEHVIDDWVEWNYGAGERFAPRLHTREREPDEGVPPSTEELVRMAETGLLTVDDEVEGWLRQRRGLPALPEGGRPPGPPRPPLAAGRSPSRHRRAIAGAAEPPAPSLPDRPLRRDPSAQEVRAAVDFAAIETVHLEAVERAEALFAERVIPAQIAEARKAITFTKSGAKRTRVTQADMARIRVSPTGADELAAILTERANAAAAQAAAELVAQGHAVTAATEASMAATIADQAAAVSSLSAEGVTLAAQRKAVQLAGLGEAKAIADGVVDHLSGMKHVYTLDRIAGAVSMAQNLARAETFRKLPNATPQTYYASELLDAATCDPCADVDGTEYESIDDALEDYPTGGYRDCEGGDRCRGFVIVVAGDEAPEDQ